MAWWATAAALTSTIAATAQGAAASVSSRLHLHRLPVQPAFPPCLLPHVCVPDLLACPSHSAPLLLPAVAAVCGDKCISGPCFKKPSPRPPPPAPLPDGIDAESGAAPWPGPCTCAAWCASLRPPSHLQTSPGGPSRLPSCSVLWRWRRGQWRLHGRQPVLLAVGPLRPGLLVLQLRQGLLHGGRRVGLRGRTGQVDGSAVALQAAAGCGQSVSALWPHRCSCPPAPACRGGPARTTATCRWRRCAS
jgi:hypothetical protein